MHACVCVHTHVHTEALFFFIRSLYLFFSRIKGCWPDVNFVKYSTILSKGRVLPVFFSILPPIQIGSRLCALIFRDVWNILSGCFLQKLMSNEDFRVEGRSIFSLNIIFCSGGVQRGLWF